MLIAFLAWHTLAFSDPTWDAQTYGIPRVALWMNYRSVFVHMPTLQQNLFSNEWNGELGALAYGLILGRVDQLAFFNVEAMCLLAVASYWFAQLLGARRSMCALIAALVCATPALMGLAIAVKGDLLSCAGILLAFAWLEFARRTGAMFALCLALLSLALAAGAKISAIPGAAIVFVWAVWHFRADLPVFVRGRFALGAVIGSLAFLSRYVVNLVTYGSPFARVAGEETHLSVMTFVGNAEVLAARWFNAWPTTNGHAASYALSGGLGVLGSFVLVGLTMRCLRREWPSPLVLIAALGALVAMTLIPPYPWSLRYFLPFLVVPIVWALAGLDGGPKAARGALAVVVLAGGCVNFAATFVPGELNPAGDMWSEAGKIASKPPLSRVLVGYEPYAVVAGVDKLGLEAERRNIAMFNQTSGLMTQFVGSRAQNRLWLSSSLPGLMEDVREHHPDIVVIGRAFRFSMNQKPEYFAPKILAAVAPGYRWVIDNDTYLIAIREGFPL